MNGSSIVVVTVTVTVRNRYPCQVNGISLNIQSENDLRLDVDVGVAAVVVVVVVVVVETTSATGLVVPGSKNSSGHPSGRLRGSFQQERHGRGGGPHADDDVIGLYTIVSRILDCHLFVCFVCWLFGVLG